MGSAFLIMLREGLEAALIVAIVLAYLKRLDREGDFKTVWAGTAAGIALSLIAGFAIFKIVGGLEGSAEEMTEAVIAFVAAGVLTWMIFWMGRQARHIKGDLQHKVDRALATGSAKTLAAIAFVAILREGLESALFLLGVTVGAESNAVAFAGGLIGLATAAGIGYLVYKGSRKVNLRVFFRATGILIILFAAGLVAKGVHELQEVGTIGTLNEHVWDVSANAALNPDTSTVAEFMKGLFGWSPNPSIEMIVVYLAYLLPIGAAFLAQTRKMPSTAHRPMETPSPAGVSTAS
ncbi:MAG: FTR1 family protein [Actinomycetota bacterium]|nr:FTR1 family protein [Actinomycetota bacterium]